MRSMARNQNHDDSSSTKSFNTCGSPWSDLNHDLLFLVMMQMGVIDFVAFSGVCTSWRSFALSNRKKFMASRPPMAMMINNNKCWLEDFEGRKFVTLLPKTSGSYCYGTTCGYLVLYESKTRDFRLVNPITRHQFYFPACPCLADRHPIRGVLVFSRSLNRLVFVMVNTFNNKIWFSIAGTRAWHRISTTRDILDLHAFKGKIYILYTSSRVCEMRLNAEPSLTLLEIKNFPQPRFTLPGFVSSGENLYVIEYISVPEDLYMVQKLDFGEMKWLWQPQEKVTGEYVFFLTYCKNSAAIELESWAGPRSQYTSFRDKIQSRRFYTDRMWFFPHDCVNVNIIN